jgi:hypothetical protein
MNLVSGTGQAPVSRVFVVKGDIWIPVGVYSCMWGRNAACREKHGMFVAISLLSKTAL